MTKLPLPYTFLTNEPGPKHLIEALKHIGVREIVGAKHNPVILQWADLLNPQVDAWYDTDEKAWCGVFVGMCLKKAGWEPPAGYDAMRALKYASFGVAIERHKACIADIAVFSRKDGGHVGFLIGEDQLAYHVLGGNQGDSVSIQRILKSRCVAIRRPAYATFRPRRLPFITPSGAVSQNEA